MPREMNRDWLILGYPESLQCHLNWAFSSDHSRPVAGLRFVASLLAAACPVQPAPRTLSGSGSRLSIYLP